MEDYEEMASTRLDQPPAPVRSRRRWFLIGGLAFAFVLALGVGAVRGLSNGTTPAAALAQASTSSSQTLAVTQGGFNGSQTLPVAQGGSNDAQAALAATPGARGQCEALTLSSVTANPILTKTPTRSSLPTPPTPTTPHPP